MPFPIGASPFQRGMAFFGEGSAAVIAVVDARSKVLTSIGLWCWIKTTHLMGMLRKLF
jgi:hypothetical protein